MSEPLKVTRSDCSFSAGDLLFESEQRPPGAQPVKVYTGVKITHRPTGLAVFVNSERSQLRNKELALEELHRQVGDMCKYAELLDEGSEG